MLDILKKQFSTKLIFDDSYFLANLIKSCGNLLNMKNLNETVHEIIRQCRVDISRSKNIISKVNGSHNNLILLSWIEALTQIYDNWKILKSQMMKNNKERKKKRNNSGPDTSEKERKYLNKKIQNETESIHKLNREAQIISKFIFDIEKLDVCQKNLDVQISIFKFRLTHIFSEKDWVVFKPISHI